MLRAPGFLLAGLIAFGLASSAQAGPAMFEASFIFHSWGNDVTSGTTYWYNTAFFTALPLGHDCQHREPYTVNGDPSSRYCSTSVIRNGMPATGSGTLVTGGATVGVPVGLPMSAFGVTVTGFLGTYYPFLQTQTYASFVNAAGTFFAGGGAAAGKGTLTHSGMGQRAGTFIIHEGKNGFGGALGLLGAFGAKQWKYVITGKVGTYVGGGDWNMVGPVGRLQYATPTAFDGKGNPTNWANPHTRSAQYTNNLNGNVSVTQARATATPWTTGSVTVYALVGVNKVLTHEAGFDTITPGGVRSIQLVTPMLSHWIGPGFQAHDGHIGIMKLRIVPEPSALVLLATGSGILALLYRVSHRR
jgi:hypothetical protein